MATALGCCIQFRQYTGKDSILQEYGNIGLGLGAPVVANLGKLSVMQTSNYHIVMYNYFTSPALLRHLSAMGMENAPLRDMVKMNKDKRGSSDMVLMCPRTSLHYIRKIIKSWVWFPPLLVQTNTTGQTLLSSWKRVSEYWQPNIINQYNMSIGRVDCMDQNISAYIINLLTKKWWWSSILLTRYIANPT